MRHRVAGLRLSRPTAHRKALFSNLVAALFHNGRIRTTDAKARETRRLAERTITLARRVGDILQKKSERRSPEESARVVHAVRMARRVVRDRDAVVKLFDELGPRYLGRRGGYTRIIKIGQRPGDAAPMSFLELMPEDGSADTATKSGGAATGKAAKAEGKTAEKTGKGTAKEAAKKAAKGGAKAGDKTVAEKKPRKKKDADQG